MLTNCFRFAPLDSVPGLIAKICKYLKEHPGWSEEELEEQIKQIIGQTSVESFNGRTGAVVLNDEDVNNLKIASAYFAEGDETIEDLNIKDLYNRGVRFVFTNWNTLTSAYDLTFVLEYFGGSDSVVYYPMATGSGGGSVTSVNGKTGVVELRLSDILGDSGAQVKLCSSTEFTSTNLNTWNNYYEEGYRIVGVVNSDASAIDYIYLLKQDDNNHQPIALSVGAPDAYTPTNPPPYPVASVNYNTGNVLVSDLIKKETKVTVRKETNRPGLDIYQEDKYVGAIRFNIDAEDNGFYRIEEVNSAGNRAARVYTSEYQPPYPVTSVNGSTGAISVGYILSGGVLSSTTANTAAPGVAFRNDANPYPYHAIRALEEQIVSLPVLQQLYGTSEGEKYAAIYTTANKPAFKNVIDSSSAWLIGYGWGSYTGGFLLHNTIVTPDESGWITISWPNTVTTIYAIMSYVANTSYPATLYNITINNGKNIRAALSYGSSPWPNQDPFQLNLLMIAS